MDDIYRAVPDLAGVRAEGGLGRARRAVARTAARTRTRPTSSRARWRRTAASCSIAGSSTTITWTGRTSKNDRARAAYDNFHPLDGKFDDNVVIQIKHGPIDFQVREPASPLFGALEHTNEAIELQITQEYMGQARHTVFLVPMWKETLDFDHAAQPLKPRR